MGVEKGLNKPEPQLFIQACHRLDVEPAQTIMVGDSQGDIEMAQAASAAGTIGICWGNASAYHLSKADVVIASLEEIKIVPSAKNSLP